MASAGVAEDRSRRIVWPGRLAIGATWPLIIAWLTAGSIVLLLALVLWLSFQQGLLGSEGLTLDHYASLMQQPRLGATLLNTVILGTGTLAIALLLAVPAAWLIHRTDLPLRSVLVTLIVLEVLIPSFLKAIGWIMLLSPRVGLLNELLRMISIPPLSIFGLGGMMFVQGLSLMPVMFVLVSGTMQALDPSLEEAAAMSGAPTFTILRRVTAPLIRPAIFGGAIYTFVIAISIYDIPALLGEQSTPVFSTTLFSLVTPASGVVPNYGVAAVYGLFMMVPCLFALALYFRSINASRRYAVVTGKGYRPRIIALGFWKYPALAFVLLYIVLSTVFPTLVLLWTSLLPGLRMPSSEALRLVNLQHYADVLRLVGGPAILLNTFYLIVGSTLLATFLSLMISWVIARTQSASRQVLDTLAMVPLVIPGLVVSFAALLASILITNWLNLPVYGSLAVIVLAFVLTRLSFTTRLTNAALLQLNVELEEAAQMSGATRVQAMWRVVLPLIRPSIVFALIWNALWAVKEVTIALMLTAPQNQILAVRVWSLWSAGQATEAATLGIYMIAIAAALVTLLHRVSSARLDGWRTL